MAIKPESFYAVVSAAIKDFIEHGFDSTARLENWLERITEAATRSLTSQITMQQLLRRSLSQIFDRLVTRKGALKNHINVPRFTLDKVRPELRAELERRIAASAQLIKLNRQQAIEQTQRRFAGWASSVPKGGTDAAEAIAESKNVRKALAQLPFIERRVAVDQGYKLAASVNNIIAVGGGAIAAKWRSNYRQQNYDYREDHKERDDHIYLIRDSWAHLKRYVKPGKDGYYDEITAAGEEPFCRCYIIWIYALRDLPSELITNRGHEALAEARKTIAGMRETESAT